MKKNKQLTIGVSGLNNHDNPGPGIPVIRALRESDFEVRIIGLSYESLEPGIYLHDLVDKSYSVPYPSAGRDTLLGRLDYIHSMEKLDFIFPNFDAELHNFVALQGTLQERGIKTFLPGLKIFEERQKTNLGKFGEQYGINVPKTAVINNSYELRSLPEEFDFPIVIKGKFYEAKIANTLEEAISYFNKISAKWGLPILAQQFVIGKEYNVVALGDGNGNTIGAVPMKKTYINELGKAWAGVTIGDEALIEMTHELMKATKWRGGIELELMKTEDNELYMMEINPRFPAWVYLAVGAGQNLPEAAVKLGLGEEVEPMKDFEVGKMFVRYSYDHICNIEEFEKISTMGEL